jgi:hypothetical protein
MIASTKRTMEDVSGFSVNLSSVVQYCGSVGSVRNNVHHRHLFACCKSGVVGG